MKIFVLEDDVVYAKLLSHLIHLNPDHEVEIFHSAKELLNNIGRKPQAVTLDYNLPDMAGAEVLRKIREMSPDTEVIVVSAQENISTAVELMKQGAYDYVVKDETTKDRLWITLNNIAGKWKLKEEVSSLKEEVGQKFTPGRTIIGTSRSMQKVHALIAKAATTNITVSVTGETGTGKELVAKAIHYSSDRKGAPFVAVNIAAIPRELIESELFGHEKGSFTGAMTRRIGRFEEAGKGTLFLDEIGEMDINLQAKLLRVLQEKELTRVGGNELVKFNSRVIVATHRNLAEEVKKGNFREDLYYRLLGLPIHLPPVRERENDVIIIAGYFLEQFARENGMKKLTLAADAQGKLRKYPFPGNVRELKAVVELAAVMCGGEQVTAADISLESLHSTEDLLEDGLTLREYTDKIIRHYLKKHDDNVLIVAKKLDIGKSTIYRLLNSDKKSR